MANDLETLLKQLADQPQAKKAIGDIDKYKSLIDSKEGKALLGGISDSGKETIKQAASAAAAGNADSAKRLIMNMLSTPEGSALAKQAMQLYKKNK